MGLSLSLHGCPPSGSREDTRQPVVEPRDQSSFPMPGGQRQSVAAGPPQLQATVPVSELPAQAALWGGGPQTSPSAPRCSPVMQRFPPWG